MRLLTAGSLVRVPEGPPFSFLYGPVAQSVRAPACHAGGRGFKSHPGRHFAAIAQSVECILGKDEVTSSNLVSSSRSSLF